MFVQNNRKTTRFLVPWSLHRFKNHNLFTYPNISQSTLTVSINAVSQYDVQFVIFWKCLKFKNTTNQRLTSNFFLSHYVHNNISTDIFATKIRSRWSIEFYAKSSQRRHSALASELFLLRINLFYHTSLWDVWREKMGNKKKYIYILEFKARLLTELEEIFPTLNYRPNQPLLVEFRIKSFNVIPMNHYSATESIDKTVNTVYWMYRYRYYDRR